MWRLPRDVTMEVLCRLPVKDLLRCRCVAKPWRSLIDGHDFIKKHLNHSLQTNSNHGLILSGYGIPDLSWVDLDMPDRAVKLRNPINKNRFKITNVLGSCNGLLALQSSSHDNTIVLWNPSTRRFWNVELPRITGFPETFIVFGFGHDQVNDNYKLVRVSQFSDLDVGGFQSEVNVYSTKLNTWRKISHGFPYPIHYSRCNNHGVSSNNALHWLAYSQNSEISCASKNSNLLIVSFDIAAEECHELPLPDSVNSSTFEESLHVDAIRGSICLILNYKKWALEVDPIDIWMMKQYGVKDSWTKLFVVWPSGAFRRSNFVFPVAFLKNDRILLKDSESEKLVSYDMQRKVKSDVSIFGAPSRFEAKWCVESLVGLDKDGGHRKLSWKQAR